MNMGLIRRAALAVFIAASCFGAVVAPARAEDDDDKGKKEEPKFPTVGNDDIFGYTTATELGDAGDTEFANENDGRVGKRQGSYGALNSKYEFSYVINPDWWVAASAFLAWNNVRNVTGFPNKNTFDFDGFSTEVAHRVITRSETNPWAVTLSVEPRWSRIDGESGFRADAFGFEAKVFVDRVLVPDTYYWAANAVWAPQWSRDPFNPGNNLIGSTATLSTAVTWQFSPGWYVGAEARYFANFARIVPDHLQGQALYVGPTILWKVNEKVSLNATFQPQIWGRSESTPGMALDLDNFERAMFRVKLAWQLN
jgi:hypothetical protein